jgi:succinate dehydrogenase flavin-adding protein (antitoxin of CptAB toxin-antitoxin module)
MMPKAVFLLGQNTRQGQSNQGRLRGMLEKDTELSKFMAAVI